jgi:hypothetical protein
VSAARVNSHLEGAFHQLTGAQIAARWGFSRSSVGIGHRLQQEEFVMRNLIRALIAALSLATLPMVSQAGLFVGVSVGIAPPVLPVYVQPPCPEPGYIWTPGYWAWDDGYYWVPGTWVLAPAVGFLWTPGYWGWDDDAYVWHEGYWGPHVGFYGGINYGFGYGGVGYEGGYWRGHEFYYNRAVTNVSTTNITNVYNRTVVNNVTVNRVSFNGGAGGVTARPTAAQIAVGRESHSAATPMQRQQLQAARTNTSLRAAQNGGRPAIAATQKPGVFSGHGVVAARGAERPPATNPQTVNHAASGRIERPAATSAHTERAPRADRPPYAGAASPGYERAPPLAAARPPLTHSESAPQTHATYSEEHRSYQAPPQAAAAAPQAFHGGYEGAARGPGAYPQAPHATSERATYAPPQAHAAPAPHAPERAPASAPRPAPPQGAGHERAPERPEHGERGS